MAGRTWGGFTGPSGVECASCNCPRQPAFLAYVREMARLYAAAIRPAWLWIDDDLRVNNHRPAASGNDIGCWCDECRKAFLGSPGALGFPGPLEDLVDLEPFRTAIASSPALRSAWERFSFSSLAAVAATIAGETHAVSPETRFGYQHGDWPNDSQLAVFRALREAGGGRPVGSRPGGGFYYDLDPHGPVKKALVAARQRRALGDPSWIESWLPEIETFPRAFASRTARGILLEALASLAYGMNGLSALIMDTRAETDAWYSENLLAPVAAERELLERYRDANLDTVPAGLDTPPDLSLDGVYTYALAGVPVVPGTGRTFGVLTADDAALHLCSCTSQDLLRIRAEADERAGHRLPVVVEAPSIGLVVPRVSPDGVLRTVLLLNARIEAQKPLPLRLRPGSAGILPAAAVWRAFGEKPVTLSLRRDGADALVTLPALQPWSAGWLEL
jgi:hypothetical protein